MEEEREGGVGWGEGEGAGGMSAFRAALWRGGALVRLWGTATQSPPEVLQHMPPAASWKLAQDLGEGYRVV